MIKRPDFFTRKLKYTLTAKRKVKFEYNEKKYESFLGYNERMNFQDFIGSFFNENQKKLKPDDFEIVRKNKYISKGNIVYETSLKEPFKIIPFELNREKFHVNNKYPIEILNFGFTTSGQYLEPNHEGGNFFNYLKHKIDPRRYAIEKDEIKEKEHIIKSSYNSSISYLLEDKFYKKMKELPKSGYDKMGKFIVGVYDKQFYKQFTIDLISHILKLNSIPKNYSEEKFTIDVDFSLKGIFTPQANIDLMIKKTDESFMLPITFAKHTNDIKNYKKFLEWFLLVNKEISTVNLEKNEQEIKPSLEKRITNLKKFDLGEAVYQDMLSKSFEEFELHSFVHYNILKIKSQYRTQIGKKMHFGATFLNDKFRFQLLIKHPDNRMFDNFCLSKSKIFSFDINPHTNSIKNIDSIKEFIEQINIINVIPDEELYYHYLNFEKLYKSKYFEEKQDNLNFNIFKTKLSEKLKSKPLLENEMSRKANEIELTLLQKMKENENIEN